MASGLEEIVLLLLRSGSFSGLLSGSISSPSAAPSMLWVASASVNSLDSSSIGAIQGNTESLRSSKVGGVFVGSGLEGELLWCNLHVHTCFVLLELL